MAANDRVLGRGCRRRVGNSIGQRAWIGVAVAVVLVAVAFVVWTGMRPAYDAYGWLTWGQQAAHLNLNTNAAPSWKPLTFLFTLPYALLAGRGALWLWMVTAVAGALAGAVFAARIAYRLTGPCPERRYAPVAAAAFAGLGVLGINGYWHLILIATADALVVSLCLAAIDRQLSGYPRSAWVLLVLASLGRPEAWPLACLYGLWAWRAVPSMRAEVGVGLGLIPVLWFGVAALTSPSWSIAGDIARASIPVQPGNPVTRVTSGFLILYELPMQLAALAAVVFAVVRRERTWLLLAGAALVWVGVEIGFAVHGWSGNQRFLFAPAAVLVVLVAASVGRVLAIPPRRRVLRWAAVAAVAGLVVALIPDARVRARLAHNGIVLGRTWARQIKRLDAVIARDGGPKRILACGHAVTQVSYQSILAWTIGVNVADVGWERSRWIRQGKPIVLFEPRGAGWEVRPIHVRAADRGRCARLRTDTPFG